MEKKFYVINTYGIGQNEYEYTTAEKALKERDKRAGSGWTVYDAAGNEWDKDFNGNARISHYA